MAYSTSNNYNNYDLNDEVDDKAFLANSSRPNYNKPSSATADFERKQQLLLLQKSKLEDSCLGSAKNSLALINESEQIGIKTGAELLEQKEKLARIENDLDTISGVSRQSQKNINAMNSGVVTFMFNGFKSMFKREKDKDKVVVPPTKLTSSQSANNFKDSQLNNTMNKLRSNSTQYEANQFSNRPGKCRLLVFERKIANSALHLLYIETIFEEKTPNTTTKKKDFNNQLDDHLLDMQSGIGRLKDLALGLGKEISEQNETLDVITNKADKTNTTLKVQNKAMLKQLGK